MGTILECAGKMKKMFGEEAHSHIDSLIISITQEAYKEGIVSERGYVYGKTLEAVDSILKFIMLEKSGGYLVVKKEAALKKPRIEHFLPSEYKGVIKTIISFFPKEMFMISEYHKTEDQVCEELLKKIFPDLPVEKKIAGYDAWEVGEELFFTVSSFVDFVCLEPDARIRVLEISDK